MSVSTHFQYQEKPEYTSRECLLIQILLKVLLRIYRDWYGESISWHGKLRRDKVKKHLFFSFVQFQVRCFLINLFKKRNGPMGLWRNLFSKVLYHFDRILLAPYKTGFLKNVPQQYRGPSFLLFWQYLKQNNM